MRDPIARKRLTKKMLDRWENEGGKVATDTTSAERSRPTSKDKGHRRKPSENSTVVAPASATKSRKPCS